MLLLWSVCKHTKRLTTESSRRRLIRVRISSSEINITELKLDTGIKTVIEKLDGLFLPDKGRRQFTALRRTEEKSRSELVIEIEHTYYKFKYEDMVLPDLVLAFMLLAFSGWLESDMQKLMSAIEKVSNDNMKNILKRVFNFGSFFSSCTLPRWDFKKHLYL